MKRRWLLLAVALVLLGVGAATCASRMKELHQGATTHC